MNLILSTDSYKVTHWKQYPPDTEVVYSYCEARQGAKFDVTVWFGLQRVLSKLSGRVVTMEDIEEAARLSEIHFGNPNIFNVEGWTYIVKELDGRLPLRIRAVPEGTVVPVGNVLMTVENTDPKCFWLTNYVESLLTHVWYPSTVASLSYEAKQDMLESLERTSDNLDSVNFMLHDFGYRGATTDEAAAIGGAAHLVNFMGTDTLVAMDLLAKSYGAELESLAFSVPATEHSVMTARGKEGEYAVLDQLLEEYPTGILSVVADSYDIYAFADEIVRRKDEILARDGRFVLRPDSITEVDPTPADLTLRLVTRLWNGFGGTFNSKGYAVLDDHIRVLWGDGIDLDGIGDIMDALEFSGFSVENIVFGMGGGLLQKVNRDTQRFAFKSSAQKRAGVWHDIQKNPLDASKKSKAGRLKLVYEDGQYQTRNIHLTNELTADGSPDKDDLLIDYFLNGEILVNQTLEEIRARANEAK